MTARAPTLAKIVRHERGAILVMALPMALFLIGALHYAVGIGDAIVRRETLQDAADASAFSAAVMMARGMNLIVLINVVMASLIAILVMLRLTDVMILVGIGTCTLLSWVTAGATTAAIPGLQAARVGVVEAYEAARVVVNPALIALNTAATVMRYAMPVAAEARVIDTSRRYAPPAILGFAIPSQFALPTEDGTEEQLCGKAGEYAAQFATAPVSMLLPDPVLDVLRSGLGAATQSLAAYFCASNPGPMPAVDVPQGSVRQQFPKLPKTRECEDTPGTSNTVDPKHQKVCDEAQTEMQMSEPDRRTGDCNQTDCTAYQTRVELAREACYPKPRLGLDSWTWQERDVHLSAEKIRRDPYPVWMEHNKPEYGTPRLKSGSKPPCGPDGVVDTGWNTQVDQALCEAPHQELTAPGPVIDRNTEIVRDVTYVEVMQVISCSKPVPKVSPVSTGGPAPAPIVSQTGNSRCGTSTRVHQNVKAGAVLGDDTFQLRAVLLGEGTATRHRNVLEKVVLRDRREELPWEGLNVVGVGLDVVSRFFVAQAEYYFDADVNSDKGKERLEWMWTMDWRARLVRFRLQGNAASNDSAQQNECGVTSPPVDIASACELAGGGGVCGDAGSALSALEALILH